jgi:hypothetical protein
MQPREACGEGLYRSVPSELALLSRYRKRGQGAIAAFKGCMASAGGVRNLWSWSYSPGIHPVARMYLSRNRCGWGHLSFERIVVENV